MPAIITYPTSASLQEIERDLLPDLVGDDPIFKMFPMENEDAATIMWEQRDNYRGLQQIRGLNGEPGRVRRTGGTRYAYRPGVYGEFDVIDEQEITERRQFGTFGVPIGITDLVMDKQNNLISRRLTRVRQILWSLLSTGTISVAAPNGNILQTDTYPLQTATASVAWSSTTTAKPLFDMRALQLKERGHSVEFGTSATAYANRTTINYMLNNSNAADLGGKRIPNSSTINSIDDLNKIMVDNGLPRFEAYDKGYYDENGTFQLYVPDSKVVVVGARTNGAKLGAYKMTRCSINNDCAPGPYTRVIDKREFEVPGNIELHDGHNGGPVIWYPSGVVILTTS